MTPLVEQNLSGRALSYEVLPGWARADHAGAWRAFRASARAIVSGHDALRPARPAPAGLRQLCSRVAESANDLDPDQARRFFEANLVPCRLNSEGFLTGYYEPVVAASLERNADFQAPLISLPPVFQGLSPDQMPDRAGLEAYALTSEARPVAWLKDWVEVFLVHVQGSARLRLPDGSLRRLVYAGRNGLPYTSIGRRLVETGRMAADAMSLDALKAWLRGAGQEVGQAGRALMQENRSYIYFRLETDAAPEAGPIGGQGLPLAPRISIAVDRSLWPYGLPFFIEAATALPGFMADPFSGLFVAQDTGSAILGPARADLFLGSGEAAGEAAGRIRHPAAFTVLWPRERR